jgi:hypothetical protein
VRVSLFVTCFNDTLFPQTGRATVRLLERLGCEVDFPLGEGPPVLELTEFLVDWLGVEDVGAHFPHRVPFSA